MQTGRLDNVINSGGVKINPEQVEEKLIDKIIPRFMIGGKSDVDLGEKVVLVIEGNEFSLDEAIFNVLDKYEKPKAVYFLSKFLETETGKIKRKEILKSL